MMSCSCGVLQCVAVCCSVLQCVTVCCIVLQRVAVCCSVLQCVAVSYSVPSTWSRCVAMNCGCGVLRCVAACCSVLQRVAVRCSALHRVAVCCRVLQRVAVCCSVPSTWSRYAAMSKKMGHSITMIVMTVPMPHRGSELLQCIAVCCGVVQCDRYDCIHAAPWTRAVTRYSSVFRRVAAYCSVIVMIVPMPNRGSKLVHCLAVYCGVLQ